MQLKKKKKVKASWHLENILIKTFQFQSEYFKNIGKSFCEFAFH